MYDIEIKNQQEELSGIIERVTFYNQDNGFCVFKLQCSSNKFKNLITVIGFGSSITVGEYAHCKGFWNKDKVHGLQFKAQTVHLTKPNTKFGIEKYLGSGLIKGIGPQFAKRLVNEFGVEVLDIIENTPEKLRNLSGIGEKRYKKIIDTWQNQKEVRKIIIFLNEHGLGTARAIRIYKVYKEQAIEKIKENPYRLALDIHGIGFKIADKLAISLGIDQNSIIRAEAGIRFILQQWLNLGHCAMDLEELIKNVEQQLSISIDIIKDAIEQEVLANHIIIDKADHLVFLKYIYLTEIYIAKKIFQLNQGKPFWHNLIDVDQEINLMEKYAQIKFSNSQLLAIKTSVRNKLVIITGGPGVGKTTVARSILHIISQKTNKILLCAPTGKAAKRLSESTNMPALTLHRMLAYDPKANKFKYNEENLLDVKLVLVDEVSMIDLIMFSNLLKALPMDCSLLLMGDVDQLPSVSMGAVLADLINSDRIRFVVLQEIFRQSSASQIVVNAHKINKGKLPILEYNVSGQSDKSDFYFIKINNIDELHDKIIKIVERIKLKFTFDLYKDIQILSPMNKGLGGVFALNNLLQQKFNNNFKDPRFTIHKFGNDFSVGDKVIQTINNYDKEVFNGDIGIIDAIDLEDNSLLINFDNRMVSYDFDELDEINLAYAITIHKSQGSEYPVVIIPVCMHHYTLLKKNLIYTAVTRGKSLVVVLGEIKALAIAIKNIGLQRITKLQQRMIEVFNE